MNSEPKYRRVLAGAGLVAALGLIIVGAMKAYPVLPDPTIAVAPTPNASPTFDPIASEKPVYLQASRPAKALVQLTDIEMVQHATFTGVKRQEGRFYLTYDPSQKRGKQSCPT